MHLSSGGRVGGRGDAVLGVHHGEKGHPVIGGRAHQLSVLPAVAVQVGIQRIVKGVTDPLRLFLSQNWLKESKKE